MKTLSMQVFKKDYGPVLNPLKYFSASDLESLSPYQVFTGEGFIATIAETHNCDCEYCNHEYDEEKRFFKTMKELEKELSAYIADDEVLRIEAGFYARIVKQDYSDLLIKA
jgi:hypothetical protein